jgi:hypothetical protein
MQYLATFNNAVTSSGNAICDACIQTDVGSAEHGPVVTAVINGTLFAIEFNYGGCLASFDGSTGPGCCGNALNNGNDCAHQECDSCADSASKNTCVGIVSNGACAAFGLLSSCQSEANAGNVQVCFSQTGTLAGLQPMLDLWCGGAPDAGTPVDTGADDAKDD